MNRRDFLSGIAAVSLAGLVTISLPAKVQAQANGKIFRGTTEGQIFESLDGGQSWQQIASFGKDCPILHLVEDDGVLYAQLGFRGYSFIIKSPDAKSWRTIDRQLLTSIYLPSIAL